MDSTDDRLGPILEELRRFVKDRDWEQFHNSKNLAMALASEAGELLAEYRWVPNTDADAVTDRPDARRRVEGEVADVAIALLLFCDRTGIDLPQAVREKIARNAVNYPVEQVKGLAERPGSARRSK